MPDTSSSEESPKERKRRSRPTPSLDDAVLEPVLALADGVVSISGDVEQLVEADVAMASPIIEMVRRKRGPVSTIPLNACTLCWKKAQGKDGGKHSYTNDCVKAPKAN
jgi:hypothetical protein